MHAAAAHAAAAGRCLAPDAAIVATPPCCTVGTWAAFQLALEVLDICQQVVAGRLLVPQAAVGGRCGFAGAGKGCRGGSRR
mgnify:CR=1 FL=1